MQSGRGAPMNNGHYIEALRPRLPPEALRPYPRACVAICMHLAILTGCVFACAYSSSGWWFVLGLVAGNSRAALSFLAHDVSHRSVVTNRYLLYPLELILLSPVFAPVTVWRKVHQAHHAHTNSDGDPERRYLASELTRGVKLLAGLSAPNRGLRFNVLYLHWIAWPFRHVFALLYPLGHAARFVPARPRYTTTEKAWVALELLLIVAIQIFLWVLVRDAYLWIAIMPVLISSAVISVYFFTNHDLRPIGDAKDILAASTSVIVPEICNKLHSNFAYHTEHHLFPTMNPRFYPLVRELLREHFPDQFHCVSLAKAWSDLLQSPIASPRAEA